MDGNVAMDTARTIKRLGAEEIYVIYRRARKQMPAEEKEVEEAMQEGITFWFQTNVVQIKGNQQVEEIECIKTQLVKKEGETREVPVDIENSNFTVPMDYVVMAVGSKVEEEVVSQLGVEQTRRGNIVVNQQYMTSKESVFAGGDLSGTKATVAWASRSAMEAAKAMVTYLEENESKEKVALKNYKK